MKIGERVKQFLGIESYSPYVDDYFEKSNVRSSVYLSLVIMALELWMIVSAVVRHLTGSSRRTPEWLFKHITSYIILFAAGLFY